MLYRYTYISLNCKKKIKGATSFNPGIRRKLEHRCIFFSRCTGCAKISTHMFICVSLVDITYRCAFCLLKESALKVVFFNMLCINVFRFFICFCLFNAYESQVKKSLIKCRIFLSLFYIFLQDKINDDHKEKNQTDTNSMSWQNFGLYNSANRI